MQNTDINAFSGRIARKLQALYPGNFSESFINRILGMMHPRPAARDLWDESDVILITYAGSLKKAGEAPLKTLKRFSVHLNGVVSSVHILPFFPSTSDDGFSVSDYNEVDPSLGDWRDIRLIAENFYLMIDLVINHVSAHHQWFRNFLSGRAPGLNYFIEKDPDADYQQVVRPRSTPLFTAFNSISGEKWMWTTFSADQVDLNFSNPEVLIEMIRILLNYVDNGARFIRLDAIAFLWKEKGTACLHRPQTHEVVKLLREIIEFVSPETILITETNVPNAENLSYFGQGDEAHMVYQFTLPPLLLHSLFTGRSDYLTLWAAGIPVPGKRQTFLNFTASHDGIGVRPLEGILPLEEITRLVNGIKESGGMISEKTNSDGSFSPYEMNITYYDALKATIHGSDDLQEQRFLCSQLIMLSLQGIPAIYIHSLLATRNDITGVERTGRARSINRKSWEEEEILGRLSSNTHHHRIFTEYTRILSIRKKIKAFHPDCPQRILQAGDSFFAVLRENPVTGSRVCCISNITNQAITLKADPQFYPEGAIDLLSGESPSGTGTIFTPYQTRWMGNFS